ncbi:hypothetical protein Tco_0753514 [Tanacetum coccineum]
MVSTMTTHNAGRCTAITRGGGTSEQNDQEGERSRDQARSRQGSQGGGRGSQGNGQGSQGSGRDSQESDQGCQGSSQGNGVNGGSGGVPHFTTIIAQQLQNLISTIVATMNNGQGGCSYKEFMACNPKDYDGKGDAIVYTRWIKKMESVQDMSRCEENQKVKYTTDSLIVKALTWWNSQSAVLKAGMLTDEAIRNGALKNISEKRWNNGELSRDGNVRDDNKRSRTRRAFATITNPVRKEHIAKDCRVGPRVVNPLNARNPTAAHGACFECGGTNHYKAACPRLN